MEGYAGTQFVGIDLHRRRSVIVRMSEGGEVLESTRVVNDAERLAEVLRRAGEAPEVVLEATYGWYWAADVLAAEGATVHLAHPLGVKAFEYRRVKNDGRVTSGRPRRGGPRWAQGVVRSRIRGGVGTGRAVRICRWAVVRVVVWR